MNMFHNINHPLPLRFAERGNIFFMLFGAVALVGVLGAATVSLMRGPLSTMVEVNRRTMAESQMSIASKLGMMTSALQANDGDCEAVPDGFVEPYEWEDASNAGPDGVAGSEGGGWLANAYGVSKKDPWGTNFGYCVWDTGTTVADAGCGGAGQKRLAGSGTADRTYPVLALISAGPDRTFQTGCVSFATGDANSNATYDAGEKLVVKAAGSDDVVLEYTYAEASMTAGGLWELKAGQPDTAETPKSIEVGGGANFAGGSALIDPTTGQGTFPRIVTDFAQANTAPTIDFVDGLKLTNTGSAGANCSTGSGGPGLGTLAVDNANPTVLLGCLDNSGTPEWTILGGVGVDKWLDGTDPGDIHYPGGMVGIGTVNPSRMLDVAGDAGLTGDLFLVNTKGVRWGDASTGIQGSGPGSLEILTGGSTRFTVDSSGLAGLGVGPAANTRLVIQGTGTTSASVALNVTDSAASSILYVQDDKKVGIGTVPNDALDVTGAADVSLGYKIDGNVVVYVPDGVAENILVGKDAGSLVTGDRNTVLGASAAAALTAGTDNVVVGQGAAAVLSGGDYNTLIGQGVGPTLTSGVRNILIGAHDSVAVDVPAAATDDYLNIGNTIYGDMANDYVGIGVPSPNDALDVAGNIDATGNVNTGGNFTINSVVFGPALECTAAQKLEWDNATGWSCVTDLNDGSAGSPDTLEEVLTAGNDANTLTAVNLGGVAIGSTTLSTGGTQDLELDVTGDIGADWYCDADGNNCFNASSVGSLDTFLELTDTPNVYTGAGTWLVRVNAGATALEFVDPTTLSTAAAGNTGEVQFNNGGAFAASSNFFWDNAAVELGIGTSTPGASLDISTTDSVILPRGTTAQRPGTPVNGMIRYNNTANKFEVYENGLWKYIQTGTATGLAFLDLTDTPAVYTGAAYKLAMVNPTETGIVFSYTDAVLLPSGTTAERPGTATNGMIRYNGTNNKFEVYQNGAWVNLITSGTGSALALNDLTDAYTDYVTDPNIFIGQGAGSSVQAGGGANLFVGINAGTGNTTGTHNTFLGYEAGDGVTTGAGNVAVGAQALSSGGGQNNVAIGLNAMFANNGGYSNVAIGRSALSGSTDGIWNVVIGHQAGDLLTSGDYNILIGGDTDPPTATTNSFLNIGDTIFGDLSTDQIRIGGSGALSGFSDLDVAGTLAVKLSAGTTAQRPGTPANGMIRYNSTSNKFEGYENGAWKDIIAAAGALSFLDLSDTPAVYTGAGYKLAMVNAGETGMIFSDTSAVLLPSGTTAQRPGTATNGMIRYNSTTNLFEVYQNGVWTSAIGSELWTDNTTHISRGTVRILNAGQTMTSAGLDGGVEGLIWHEDKKALRVGEAGGGGRWNEANIGGHSVAIGRQSWAVGQSSVAIGEYAYALGGGGVAIGWLPSSYGNFAVGIGHNVIASGNNSTSLGADNRVNGTYSMGIGLGSAAGTYPLVSGNNALGIFMGNHSNVNFAAANTMGLFGGKMVIDPAVPATQLTARGTLDVGAGTDAVVLTSGTTAQRPGTGVNGMIRYNADSNKFEGYQNGAWQDILTSGGGAGSLDSLSDAETDYATDFNLLIGTPADAWAIAAGGQYNLTLGQTAGDSITTGDRNVAMGYGALTTGATMTDNIAIGYNALTLNQNSGTNNVAIGSRTMDANTTGDQNVAIGTDALGDFTAGTRNTAIGHSTFSSLTSGDENVAIGGFAMGNGIGGTSANVAVGWGALQNLTTGSGNNVAIGYQAGHTTTTGFSNILIGNGATAPAAGTSNFLNIGGTIFGDLSTDQIRIGGSGALSGFSDLDVAGTLAVKLSAGTTAQRPGTPANGMIRYNSTNNKFEAYENGAWVDMIVSSASAGIWERNGTVVRTKSPVDVTTDDFVFGSTQLGDTGSAANDSRMFFDKSKGAFRAGSVDSAQWDDANVGDYSIALGQGNTASAPNSVAIGYNSIASADRTTALGAEAEASAYGASALGSNVWSRGSFSTAIGRHILVTGMESIGLGAGSTGGTFPTISSDNSVGIFMGNQGGIDLAANNTMGVFGGKMVIDPAVPATQLTARGTLDVGAGTDAVVLTRGTTAQRPGTPANGMIRYNATTNKFEAYENGAWVNVIGGSASSVALSSVTAALADNTIANGNWNQVWNWQLTGATEDAFTFGENTASTGGSGDQSVLKATTLASSTAVPLMVTNLGNSASFRVNDETGDNDTTPFMVDANGNVGINYDLSGYFHSILNIALPGGSGEAVRWGPPHVDSTTLEGTLGYDGGSSTVIAHSRNADFAIEVDDTTTTRRALLADDATGYVLIGEGASSVPGAQLHVNTTSTTGNTVLEALRLSHEDSNSAAANNIGAALTFNLETATNGTNREAARIAGVWDDATNNSKDGSLRFYTMGPNATSGTTTTTEAMRIVSGGISGAGATPITGVNVGAIAFGDAASATQNWSAAIGWEADATGQHTYAIGSGVSASGYRSMGLNQMVDVSGGESLGIGLGVPTATSPEVQGNNALGIFMGNQDAINFAANNTMGVFGGKMVIDPAVPATQLTARGTLDVGAGTDAVVLTSGTTAQRPGTGVNGMIRYNATTNKFEAYENGAWVNVIGGSASSVALSSVTAALADNTILNGNWNQVWNWQLTGATEDAFTFGENTASTGGSGDQSVLKATTLASSTAVPLMVTNLGDGLSLRINDETGDADTTPVVVTATGQLGVGATAPGVLPDYNWGVGWSFVPRAYVQNSDGGVYFANDAGNGDVYQMAFNDLYTGEVGPSLYLSRARGTQASPSIVTNGDALGYVTFAGYDGVNEMVAGASIKALVDGTPGNNDMPTSLNFMTTPDGSSAPTTRMVISESGNVTLSGTGAMKIHAGTTAQRPGTGVNGMIRYNADSNKFEGYQNGAWQDILTSGGGAGSLDSLSDAETDYATDFNLLIGTPADAWAIAAGGQYNLTLGQTAGDSITTGDRNVAMGYGALTTGATMTDNIAIGYNALTLNQSGGVENIAIGSGALDANTTGDYSIAIGIDALGSFTGTNPNTVIGNGAGSSITSGEWNTIVGFAAGQGSTSGSDNVFIGNQAGQLNDTGGNNVYIGQAAAQANVGSSNIIIGGGATTPNNTTSSFLNIGDTIFGDLANDRIRIGGSGAVGAFNDLELAGTLALKISAGTTAERPGTPVNGMIRYNSTTNLFEAYQNGAWTNMIGSGIWTDSGSGYIEYTNSLGGVKIGNVTGAAAPLFPTSGSAGASTFLALTDTPAAYTGAGYQVVKVNAGATALEFGGTDSLLLPSGTTAQRPGTPSNGMIRYNSTTGQFEGYQSGAWGAIAGSSIWSDSGSGYIEYSNALGGIKVGSVTGAAAPTVGYALDDLSDVSAASPALGDVVAWDGASSWTKASGLTSTIRLPSGTTAQRPGTPANGMIRYNSTLNKFEAYENGAWTNVIGGGAASAAGSNTQIQFNDGGTNLGADSLFVWDKTNDRLGVGVAAPLVNLHVQNPSTDVVAAIQGLGSAALDLIRTGVGSNDWRIRNSSSGTFEIVKYTNDDPVSPGTGQPSIRLEPGRLYVHTDTTTGNTIENLLSLEHDDSNSAAASGIGAAITFDLETATAGTSREAARIAGVWDDATNNSKDGSLRFYTMGPNAASGTTTTSEVMRIVSGGISGAGATPITGVNVGAIAFGDSASATSNWSAAIGGGASATNQHAFAMGYGALAAGYKSLALGRSMHVTGDRSVGISAGEPSATRPEVQGNDALGIFMGDQNAVDFAANNTMGVFGGKMVIDPAVPATQLTARGTLDVGAGTDAVVLTSGTTAQRPGTGVNGMIRYNSTLNKFEAYENGAWTNVIGGGGTPAGADREIQFNNAGAFGASSTFKLMSDGDLLLTGTFTGTASVPVSGAGTRMFFDTQKAAFRAGIVGSDEWDNANIGNYSVALGRDAKASGPYGIALGYQTDASGYPSVAIGERSQAWGGYSLALSGYEARASGDNSTAIGGERVTASGNRSIALGTLVVAGNDTAGSGLGDGAMAIGLMDNAVTITTRPQVTGIQSLGIFMGDQDGGLVMSAANTMGLFGGKMVIDPAVPATQLTARGVIDAGAATDAIVLPRGTDAQRPGTPAGGMFRYNTTATPKDVIEYYDAESAAWLQIPTSASGGAPLSGISAATGTNTIASGDNAQVWNWALTTATKDAFTFGETTAATGGSGDQSVLKATALASSTAVPLMVTNLGNSLSLRVNDATGDADTTPFVVDASGNVGIGTLTPSKPLSIVADDPDINIDFSATPTGAQADIFFNGQRSSVSYDRASESLALSGDKDGNSVGDLYLYGKTSGITVKNNGNVGIGMTTPSVALDVTGDIEYSGTITDVSDIRLKTDIRPLNERGSMLDKIGQIDTYSFRMKDDPKKQTEFGVVAQEIEKVFPELVRTDDTPEHYKSVNYVGMIAPVIESAKELKAKNETMKAELDDLKEQVALLNKAAIGQTGKASMDGWVMLLVGLMIGGNLAFFVRGGILRRKRG